MSRAGSKLPRTCLKQGRRRIAFIGTAETAIRSCWSAARLFARALRAAGIEPDERFRLDAAPSECDGRAAVANA